MLAMWPRKRPNGHIWSGKHKMVLKVKDKDVANLEKDIKMVRTLFKFLHLILTQII